MKKGSGSVNHPVSNRVGSSNLGLQIIKAGTCIIKMLSTEVACEVRLWLYEPPCERCGRVLISLSLNDHNRECTVKMLGTKVVREERLWLCANNARGSQNNSIKLLVGVKTCMQDGFSQLLLLRVNWPRCPGRCISLTN